MKKILLGIILLSTLTFAQKPTNDELAKLQDVLITRIGGLEFANNIGLVAPYKYKEDKKLLLDMILVVSSGKSKLTKKQYDSLIDSLEKQNSYTKIAIAPK